MIGLVDARVFSMAGLLDEHFYTCIYKLVRA
jgi:hypothetical protein